MRVRLWAGGAEGRWMVCLCLWVPRWLERGRSASAPSRIGKALWFWFHCSHQRPSSLPHAGPHVDPANTGNPPASTMADDAAARLETELLLLDAMYPHQTHYHPKSRELSFSQDDRASLLLRLPESYPASGSPDIISLRLTQPSTTCGRALEMPSQGLGWPKAKRPSMPSSLPFGTCSILLLLNHTAARPQGPTRV
jgi:hypothetical protein